MATAQLQLIHTDHSWKLDRRTVEIGRAGIAQARAALAAATAVPEGDDRPFEPGTDTSGTHQAAA